MNLGGASNVDLTEAARLLKQSAIGVGAGVQNQQVPPPGMMLMQHAVAMQQFQFQQALLMQQVMATQQAAARAATVKSAQEMAAARAAEISKQLKGNEPELEREKKSPVRSLSWTPSRPRSRARSFSRSKSRSPHRYRRDRSASQSPIRYRRDSRPSPLSREYYGYRGRSRRGYYRGRGEYPWNPSYRHDWEREKEHSSSRSRRSRSRSRSRVRRRSPTRSRSLSRRDRSGTPLRYHREERRLGRGSRRSISVEVRPTPSRSSCSRSCSRSRSGSESLELEHGKQSSARKSRDTRTSGAPSRGEKLSPMPNDDQRTLMGSLDTKGSKEKNFLDEITDVKELMLEQLSSEPKGRDEQSISSARSLSVSLSPPRSKNVEALEGGPKSNDWKKVMLRDTLVQRTDEVATLDDRPHSDMTPSAMGTDGGEGSPPALLEQELDTKVAFKSEGGDFIPKGRNINNESSRMESSSYESDGNKAVDDWRDDIKANELEKMKRMESRREMESREEQRKTLPVQIVVQEEVKDHGMTLLDHLSRGTGKLTVESSFTSEGHGDINSSFKPKKGISRNDVVSMKPKYSDGTRLNGNRGFVVKEILDRVSTGNGENDMDMDKKAGDVTREKSIGSADVSDKEEDSDVVFEGPLPPHGEVLDLEGGKSGLDSSKGEDSAEEIGAVEPPSVPERVVGNIKGKDKSSGREEEDVLKVQGGKDKSKLEEDDESNENLKSKEKSRSSERSKSKRYDDEADYERWKDKHRKHKRRHRRDEGTEREEDDDDEKRDVDSSKDEERRHHRSKKHRSGRDHKEDKREKKKRRHKHRGKSTLESPDKESLVAEVEGEDVNEVAGRLHKKQSSSRENRRKEASKSPVHASDSGSD